MKSVELAEGSIVASRFRLNRLLGRGGMGSVWHATHLGLDIPCAVKFIEGEFASLPEAQARFEREAKAAAQLRSPHVVQILDHGISEGVPYIAMELLDGEDLGKRLTRVGRLAPAETGAVVLQVCRALTKAHSLGIVHRDLKPDNIFLVRDDDREIAKVLDFGIAKSSTSGIDGSNTKTGAMLGTPYYMSPEQAQGTKSVDYRSDLWSLAVIVFQCITGRLPFESEALGDLLVRIIVAEMPVPSHFGAVPAAFDAWWTRAASRDPNQRFQSAKEFGDSLASVLGQSGATDMMSAGSVQAAIGAAITPRPDGSRPFMHTPPSAMAQSVAAEAGGGAGQGHGGPAAGSFNATTGAPIARTYGGLADGSQAPAKKNAAIALAAAVGLVVIAGLGAAFFLGKGTHGAQADVQGGGTAAAANAPAIPSAPPEPPKVVEPPKSPEPVVSAAPAAPVPVATVASAEPAKKPEPEAKPKPESTPTHTSRHSAGGSTTKPATPSTTTTKPKSETETRRDFGF
jgi:serine/threonine-protein kinase